MTDQPSDGDTIEAVAPREPRRPSGEVVTVDLTDRVTGGAEPAAGDRPGTPGVDGQPPAAAVRGWASPADLLAWAVGYGAAGTTAREQVADIAETVEPEPAGPGDIGPGDAVLEPPRVLADAGVALPAADTPTTVRPGTTAGRTRPAPAEVARRDDAAPGTRLEPAILPPTAPWIGRTAVPRTTTRPTGPETIEGLGPIPPVLPVLPGLPVVTGRRLSAVGREPTPKHGASRSTGDWAADSHLPGAWRAPRWSGAHRGRVARPWRRGVFLLLLAAAVAAFAVLAAAAVAFGDRVPRGTTIAGVDVGGRSRSAAMDALSTVVSRAGKPLPVSAGGRSATLDPARAGLLVNPAASVDAVIGSRFDPGRLWREVVGGDAASTLPAPDRSVVRAALQDLAKRVDVPAVDGAVRFGPDGPQRVAPVPGSALDVSAAADLVAARWLEAGPTLQLPVRVSRPRISQAEVDRALTQLAQPAASGPLTLVLGTKTLIVPAANLSRALSVTASGPTPDRLELVVDGTALRSAVLALDPAAQTPPVDARIVLRDNAPVVIPSVDGTRLDPAALAVAVKAALLTPQRRAVVTPVSAPAAFDTAAATALGVKQKVSTFSTVLTSNQVRTGNLRIAARTVNGTLVLPGETFSLNAVLGRRTPQKGYQQAPVINGGRLTLDYGGGVSQLATTLFNNVFFAGLEDVHHMAHSFYISRYPEGREATVSFPTVDLVWRNNSPYAVLVQADITSTVNVSFWSTKVHDVVAEKGPRTNPRQPKTVYDAGATCVPQVATPGFDVTVRRKLYRDGALVRTQSWTTSYQAEDHVICGPKPAVVTGTPTD